MSKETNNSNKIEELSSLSSGDKKLSPDMLSAIKSKLGSIDEVIKVNLEKRRSVWKHTNETVFKDASLKFNEIRSQITKVGCFSNMGLKDLSDCLAFLSAYYSHIVELEGNAQARKVAYERIYNDNLSLLKAIGVVSGRGYADYRAEAIVCGFETIFLPLEEQIKLANHDLSILGIIEKKQTSRADAIKMIIEVFKKRHDSLKDEKMLYGKNR